MDGPSILVKSRTSVRERIGDQELTVDLQDKGSICSGVTSVVYEGVIGIVEDTLAEAVLLNFTKIRPYGRFW